jgi:hypothetical protein
MTITGIPSSRCDLMEEETRMKRYGVMVLVAATTLAAFVAGSSTVATAGSARAATCSLPVFGPGRSYHPTIRPGNFSPEVTNSWFPLIAGTTFVYTGHKDKQKALDVYAISKRTKKIDGVATRIVNDRLFLGGRLSERTTDYYAQDKCGNVWYFGEDTAVLNPKGHVVDTSGSFHAGVDGAQPGVFMQADPQIGRKFRQEWYQGQAADQFHALSKSASVTVRYGAFNKALRTAETTQLEPGVLDNKYYVKGIGEVLEVTVKGPFEKLQLVDVLH